MFNKDKNKDKDKKSNQGSKINLADREKNRSDPKKDADSKDKETRLAKAADGNR